MSEKIVRRRRPKFLDFDRISGSESSNKVRFLSAWRRSGFSQGPDTDFKFPVRNGWRVGGVPPDLRLEHKITRFLRFGSPMIEAQLKHLSSRSSLFLA